VWGSEFTTKAATRGRGAQAIVRGGVRCASQVFKKLNGDPKLLLRLVLQVIHIFGFDEKATYRRFCRVSTRGGSSAWSGNTTWAKLALQTAIKQPN
jgi:hypothetical protein